MKEETPVLALIRNKKETQTELLSKKKKIALTRDFVVNGIYEKGLSVNHKVKIVNFPGGRSEKILEKQDDIIKEQPDDLIVYVGTNDLTNNVNLLTSIKKSSIKLSQESPSRFIAFSSVINRKDKTNTRKTLTDANACLKNFCMQKEINFNDNSVLRNFIYVRTNFI